MLPQPCPPGPQVRHRLPSQCHSPMGHTLLFPQPFPWLPLCPNIPASLLSRTCAFFPLLFQPGSSFRPQTVSASCTCLNRGGSQPGAATVKSTFALWVRSPLPGLPRLAPFSPPRMPAHIHTQGRACAQGWQQDLSQPRFQLLSGEERQSES